GHRRVLRAQLDTIPRVDLVRRESESERHGVHRASAPGEIGHVVRAEAPALTVRIAATRDRGVLRAALVDARAEVAIGVARAWLARVRDATEEPRPLEHARAQLTVGVVRAAGTGERSAGACAAIAQVAIGVARAFDGGIVPRGLLALVREDGG